MRRVLRKFLALKNWLNGYGFIHAKKNVPGTDEAKMGAPFGAIMAYSSLFLSLEMTTL